jgi:hypothetical protein
MARDISITVATTTAPGTTTVEVAVSGGDKGMRADVAGLVLAHLDTLWAKLAVADRIKGFSTCCLRFKDGVTTATCKTRFRLAGWPLPGGSITSVQFQ